MREQTKLTHNWNRQQNNVEIMWIINFGGPNGTSVYNERLLKLILVSGDLENKIFFA